MMYDEFMKIAGYKVNYDDYKNIIEPLYMAAPDNMTKTEFIACLSRKRFEVKTKTERQYINEIKKISQYLYENCGRSSFCDEKSKIEEIRRQLEKQYGYDTLIIKGYEYEEIQRGCTYPKTLILYFNGTKIKEIPLTSI